MLKFPDTLTIICCRPSGDIWPLGTHYVSLINTDFILFDDMSILYHTISHNAFTNYKLYLVVIKAGVVISQGHGWSKLIVFWSLCWLTSEDLPSCPSKKKSTMWKLTETFWLYLIFHFSFQIFNLGSTSLTLARPVHPSCGVVNISALHCPLRVAGKVFQV